MSPAAREKQASAHGSNPLASGLPNLSERFWSKVSVPEGGGCWAWTGSKSTQGYGRIRRGSGDKSFAPAHRVAYELMVGPVPAGKILDHICHNRACVNPAHLRPCTNAENSRNKAVDKIKGIRWDVEDQAWHVSIGSRDKRARKLGRFFHYEDAKEAYLESARSLWGDFAPDGR